MSRRTLPTAPKMRDGRYSNNDTQAQANIDGASGPTASYMRSLIIVLFVSAWFAAQLLLSWWPGLTSVPG